MLVNVPEVKLYLKNESGLSENDALLGDCVKKAQTQAENWCGWKFEAGGGGREAVSAESAPEDLKGGIIKLALAAYIRATTNVSFIGTDGSFVDKAAQMDKEARLMLQPYRVYFL